MTSSSSEIKLDWDRTDRIGLAEAIFCLQKSVEQIQSILEEALKEGGVRAASCNIICTQVPNRWCARRGKSGAFVGEQNQSRAHPTSE